jgi:YVTN family beta-propeller protein
MSNGKTAYVANIFGGAISVIDTGTRSVIDTIKTAPFPNGLALARNGRSIYITNFSGGTMQVLDLKTRKVSAPVRTSRNPSYLALSADGKQAYYVHPMGNTVSVVDTKTLGLASTIVVGKNPTAIGACPFPGRARVVAAAQPPAPADSAGQRFSVDTTPLGELLDNAEARAVVTRHVPTIVDNPQIGAMRGMTLSVIRIMGSGMVSEAQLKAIEADLAKLPAR